MTLNNINSLSVCFFLGAKRRSNPLFFLYVPTMDCFAALAMTVLAMTVLRTLSRLLSQLDFKEFSWRFSNRSMLQITGGLRRWPQDRSRDCRAARWQAC